MAALAPQSLRNDGTLNFVNASVSDTAAVGNGINSFLIYKNSTAAPVTVTVVVPGKSFLGADNPDNAVAVPANGIAFIPLRREYQGEDGRAVMTMASATGMTVALVRMG